LTFFYDTGKLWDTKDTSVEDSFRSSVGTGLRYITPIGAVGILYGHKLDPRPEEDPGRFHISIGYTF
jgi:outer membrane protein insertion porin family